MITPPTPAPAIAPAPVTPTPKPVQAPSAAPVPASTPTTGGNPTPQWSTQSFAGAIRTKYPTGIANDGTPYANLSDQELTSRMVAKYPVYAKQIADFQPKFDAKVEKGNPITDYASNLTKDFADTSDAAKISGDIQRSGENFNNAKDTLSKAGALLQGLYQVGGHVIGGAAGKIMAPLTALGETAGQDSKTVQDVATSKPVDAAASAVHPAIQGIADWAEKHPDAAADLNATIQYAGLAIGGPKAVPALDSAKEGVDAGIDATKSAASAATDVVKSGAKAVSEQTAKATEAQAARQATKKAAQVKIDTKKGINAIAPKLTTGEMRSALATGKVKNELPTGAGKTFKNIKTDFSGDPHLHAVHESVKDFIDPNAKTATENLHRVQAGISSVSEHEIKPHLEANPVPFNFEDLRGYLDNVHPSPAIKADPAAFKNFNRTKEDILNLAEEHLRQSQTEGGKNVSGLTDVNDLWEPGKAIDAHIQNQLGESTFDTPQYTGIKAASSAMRNGFRQFMSDSMRYPGQMELFNRFKGALSDMPKNMREKMGPAEEEDMASQMGLHSDPQHAANAAYLDRMMSEVSRMFEARDNLAAHSKDEQGTSAYRRFMDAHPIIKTGTRGAIRTGALSAGMHIPL